MPEIITRDAAGRPLAGPLRCGTCARPLGAECYSVAGQPGLYCSSACLPQAAQV
jgi:hypothetical protein